MQNVAQMPLINPQTRGDFRQATESAQKRQNGLDNAREKLTQTWASLADAYGNAFTNQFGLEPNDTWAAGLSDYPESEILAAVGRLITRGEQYAPNLATILGEIAGTAPAPFQHLQRRTVSEVLSAPIIDRGEGNLLPPPADDRTPEEIISSIKSLFS